MIIRRLGATLLVLLCAYFSACGQISVNIIDTLRLKVLSSSGLEMTISSEFSQNVMVVLYNEYSCGHCFNDPTSDSTGNKIFLAALSSNYFKNYRLAHHVKQLYGSKLYFTSKDCLDITGMSRFCFNQDIGPFFIKVQVLVTD